MYKNTIIKVLIAILIIGFIFYNIEKTAEKRKDENTNNYNYSNSKYSEDKTKLIIKMYVEDIIKEKLKSPSTAKFPSLSDWSIYEKSYNTYSVSSYVDAENGFGAEIRTYFSLTVTTDNEILDYSDLYYSE